MIKQAALEAHFYERGRERELALLLDEAFDVSSGRSIDGQSLWIVSPKEHIAERFGMTKEVLALYSPYAKQDARALTFASDYLSRSKDRDRLDQTLVLLVHEGTEDAGAMFEEESERVFVAISAQALSEPSRGSFFLRNLISARLGSADLFGISSPIRSESKFFGRAPVAEDLARRLFARHESVGIFGLRKTGKTSLLRAIQRRAPNFNAIAVYLDCENPGLYQARWWEMLATIADRCAQEIGIANWKSRLKVYTDTNASIKFHSDMREIVAASSQSSSVAILLDEIEYITPKVCGARAQHWDEDFVLMWQTVRSLQQESPEVASFCVAGVNPACVEQTHFDGTPNPLFQLAIPIHLEPLSVESVRSMVRTVGRYSGLKFDEAVYPYLTERFGGHAFLIRLACSEVWKNSSEIRSDVSIRVGIHEFQVMQLAIKSRLTQPVKDILLSLVWWYADEYDVLRVLAEGDRAFFRDYVASESGSLIQFAKYGLVDLDTGEFRVPELREFLIDAGSDYKAEISPFRRSELPPEILPSLPDIRTLGRIFERKVALETWLRRVIVAFLGVKYGFNSHRMSTAMLRGVKKTGNRRDPANLFVGRAPAEAAIELYTAELGDIIAENWDEFSSIFESKPKFQEHMAILNKARRADGHSKPVSDEEFADYMTSFDWMSERISVVPRELLGGGAIPPI